MSSPSSASVAAPAVKICFNTHCKESVSDHQPPRRRGWRLRSGEIAELCDRCSYSLYISSTLLLHIWFSSEPPRSVGCFFPSTFRISVHLLFYDDVLSKLGVLFVTQKWSSIIATCLRSAFEQGTFCETFHADDSGWRNCETCVKRLHCGCIVSAQTYVFLDAGGVECIACARKSLTMAPNQISSSLVLMQQHVPERRDSPAKTWRSIATPLSGQWRQAPHMWNMTMQSDLQQRLSYEFDRPSSIEKLAPGGRHSISAHEKKFEPERKIATNLNNISRDKYTHGNTGENDPMSIRKSVSADPCSTSSLVNFEAKPNSSIKLQQLPVSKENSSLLIGLPASFSSSNGVKDPMNLSPNQPPAQVTTPLSKQFYPQRMNEAELQVQMRNGRTRVDTYPRTQLLPRYWPRITNQEMKQISGDPQSSITPLFEKMLSASDAGRIGRLVLPKKCAEAYFPAISQPEGLPLKVQDASGKDWVFQFRFWPNNNSRMYVLEGVTPCIQAMQLQAGDTVTFSRIDPEGKLVMGFRKASNSSIEQDPETHKSSSEISPPPEDQITSLIQKDGSTTKLLQVPSKRKAKTLGSKSYRLRIENEESMELKLTWEEAQKLLRPAPNSSPSIVVIEGHEFEEYEEAPVLGKKTYLTSDQAGESHQWVRCEECLKWRKVPVDALLLFRWTCLENVWDPERSSCSSAQELSLEQIADMVSCKSGVLKKGKAKAERDSVEVSDGLDTLANLAILGYTKSLQKSSQPTTRHPRHKPGCTCIVCIQPPSGKGPKHKPHCTCNVCLTVKRRFRTLELRREKRQSEKASETPAKQKSPILPSPLLSPQPGSMDVTPTGPIDEVATQKVDTSSVDMVVDEASDHRTTSASPLKTRQIDLNIQPEREEEPLTQHQSVTLVPY
ncbi:B3 domain-containing protein Os07g0563300-like isoform X2 [Zingiber officinale]|uniref:B3 domain-containing protein Os07g0563300-like isoform X2 n=1 Tax=Zingiber officinale TaxID=94328 RepID=UPI001C4B1CFC|nr:B3 domain-containing protein Os07g0563300-like isoform X2 [Zingiber officinale]